MKYGEATMGQFEAVINKLGGMEGLQKFLSGELVIKTPELLQQMAVVALSTVAKFVAKDHFKVDTSKKAQVRIGYLGDNFVKYFLGKVEESVPGTTLTTHTLKRDSLDAPILAELGDRKETTLTHLYELMSRQPKGESGVLLTNGYWNVFYIMGTDGNLWAVRVCWSAGYDCWRVGAYSVDDPDRWDAGDCVVSR